MCKLNSKTFLVLLVLLVLVPLQVFAWARPKNATPVTPIVNEQVQEPLQTQPAEKEVVVVEVPSPAKELTEQDKSYLKGLSQELMNSLEESSKVTKDTIKIKTEELSLLLNQLDQLRTSQEVKDAAHEELEEAYVAKEAEYNSLADAYAKSKRSKLMLGLTSSMDVKTFTFGAGFELGVMGQNFYTTVGVDKDLYTINQGRKSWHDDYRVTAKFGLLF